MADVDAQTDLYEADFAAWADRQAALARAGEFALLDLDHIAGEMAALGGRERRELRRRLARLMQHLLKWAYQPELRSRSWSTTILMQRSDIAAILDDSPSLRPTVADTLPSAFGLAHAWAAEATGLLHLPPECPWSAEQIMSDDFLPDGPVSRG